MSRAELAREAGISALTVDRVEHGKNCRMDTKRKIILALGLKLADKDKVFAPIIEEDERPPEQTREIVAVVEEETIPEKSIG